MVEMELLEGSLETRSAVGPKNAEPYELIIANMSLSAENVKLCNKQENLLDRGIIDIDSKHKDPQMCGIYVVDIYNSLHAAELDRRPLVDYMEKLQQDITIGMRGVLIDWLMEVVKMESRVLNFLGFQISVPTTKKLLRRFIQAAEVFYKNPTLEHYTRYKAPELKSSVLELQELQLNTSGCLLNAIHDRFKQSKCKGVSTLRSLKPVQSLFT